MAKSKKVMIKELVALGHEEATLKELTAEELKAKLAEGNVVEEVVEEKVEVVIKEVITPVVKEEVVEEFVLSKQQVKLSIHDVKVVHIHPAAKKVVVENLGGGDMYVTADLHRIGRQDVLRPGEVKVFTNTRSLLVKAASRPIISVTQLA